MDLLKAYLVKILAEPTYALSTPRVRVDECLRRAAADGHKFWGSLFIYTRSRTAVQCRLFFVVLLCASVMLIGSYSEPSWSDKTVDAFLRDHYNVFLRSLGIDP